MLSLSQVEKFRQTLLSPDDYSFMEESDLLYTKDRMLKWGLPCSADLEILIVVEPRVSGQKASKILKRLGFTNWIRVEALGFSGGICLLWRNSEFDADYVYSNPQLLHCLVTKRKTRESVLVTGVFGETNPSGRMALWDSL
ncbi:hypothetical protein Tco_0106129 [Tanacetum coccineum]